jgi:hypothetical protein
LQEPEIIKSLLENPNFNPAGKKSFFHQFLMPSSGLNTIKLKTVIVIQQGTIRAFPSINLP